jgi:hypothetical protein
MASLGACADQSISSAPAANALRLHEKPSLKLPFSFKEYSWDTNLEQEKHGADIAEREDFIFPPSHLGPSGRGAKESCSTASMKMKADCCTLPRSRFRLPELYYTAFRPEGCWEV